VTKFCAGTILTSKVMDCQTRAIGKAIRHLFAEPVTYCDVICWLIIITIFKDIDIIDNRFYCTSLQNIMHPVIIF